MALRPKRNPPHDPPPKPPPKPWEHGEGESGGSLGSWLRQHREIRNINLREISDSTKIGMRYLEALEEDRFDVLPAGVFARGFLREYAKYVGLDPDEVVTFYLAEEQERRAEAGELEDEDECEPTSDPWRPSRRGVALGLAIVMVLVLLVWALDRARDRERAAEGRPPPIAPPVVPVPEVVDPTPASPAHDQDLIVTIGFTDECWVEALVDGQQRISELKVQGESMQIEARERVVLTLGNASAVRIEVNGRPFPLDVAPGRVLRELEIDRSAAGLPPLEEEASSRARPGLGAAQ